ncbi:DUF4258 domain-containing protein [Aureimonas flava]|uniref:DUF4258 domain-containing protein n=1 Tax=Aureimonas flava TaxID=2320271 RepID=A0A3A1WS13_9HYPH|nr:DUF4258 domain-containing protein [Aureimonas flava]
MTDDPPPQRVSVCVPKPHVVAQRVRQLAANSENVRWSQHALDRMAERDITIRQALYVLREGDVVGPIELGKYPGELKAKFIRNMRGRRDVGVVVLLVKNGRLNVKTVEWEDIR